MMSIFTDKSFDQITDADLRRLLAYCDEYAEIQTSGGVDIRGTGTLNGSMPSPHRFPHVQHRPTTVARWRTGHSSTMKCICGAAPSRKRAVRPGGSGPRFLFWDGSAPAGRQGRCHHRRIALGSHAPSLAKCDSP